MKVIDLSDRRFHPASPAVYVMAFEATLTPRTKLLSFCHIDDTDGGVLSVIWLKDVATVSAPSPAWLSTSPTIRA